MKPFALYEYKLAEPEGPLSRAGVLEEIAHPAQLISTHIRSHEARGVHLTETLHPALFQTPLHFHYCPLFYLVLDGALRDSYGKSSQEYRNQDVIYIPKDEPHSHQFQDKDAKGVMIEVAPELVEQSVGMNALPPYPMVLKSTSFGIASRILMELRLADPYSPSVIQSLSVELLANAARMSRGNAPGGKAPAWLKRVTDHLAAEGKIDKSSLRDLAKEAGVHPVSLARAFRRHHGCTLGEFMRLKNIRVACEKLRHSRLTIGEVAQETGFADQSHFTRCFKKVMGVSPGTYKRSI